MQPLQGVIFDMDGLLFDTEQLYCDIAIALAPEFGLKGYDEAYYHRYLGISNREMIDYYQKDFPYLSEKEITSFIETIQKEADEALQSGKAILKTGVREILQCVAENHIQCAIASNNNRSTIKALLRQHQLDHYFKVIFSADDVTETKPNKEMVVKAVDALGLTPQACIMLDDSVTGVSAGLNAGVPTIMVNDSFVIDHDLHARLLHKCDHLHEVREYLISTYLR